MAEIPIGESGGIGGIPTKYLLMGAGGLLVAFLLLRQQSSGSGTPSTGNALGPNASLALGSLDTDLRQQAGDIQQLIQKQGTDLGTHLDAQAQALGGQITQVSNDNRAGADAQFQTIIDAFGREAGMTASIGQGLSNLGAYG